MQTADPVRPRFAPLLARVREWTAYINEPFMPWIYDAIKDKLEWERSQPRCDRCGSGVLEYGCGDYPTGVTAPDGGCEMRHEEYYQCGQCGTRQSV